TWRMASGWLTTTCVPHPCTRSVKQSPNWAWHSARNACGRENQANVCASTELEGPLGNGIPSWLVRLPRALQGELAVPRDQRLRPRLIEIKQANGLLDLVSERHQRLDALLVELEGDPGGRGDDAQLDLEGPEAGELGFAAQERGGGRRELLRGGAHVGERLAVHLPVAGRLHQLHQHDLPGVVLHHAQHGPPHGGEAGAHQRLVADDLFHVVRRVGEHAVVERLAHPRRERVPRLAVAVGALQPYVLVTLQSGAEVSHRL